MPLGKRLVLVVGLPLVALLVSAAGGVVCCWLRLSALSEELHAVRTDLNNTKQELGRLQALRVEVEANDAAIRHLHRRASKEELPPTMYTLEYLDKHGIDFLDRRIVPNHPDLRSAMSCDPFLNDDGDRDEAVKHYLSFVRNQPASPFKYRVLAHIAGLYSQKSDPAMWDNEKAREFCSRAYKAAGELLNLDVISVRVNSGAHITDAEEQRRAYIETINWLTNLSENDIRKRWGTTQGTMGKMVGEKNVRNALGRIEAVIDVVGDNLVFSAKSDKGPIKALREIAEKCTDAGTVAKARKELETLEQE